MVPRASKHAHAAESHLGTLCFYLVSSSSAPEACVCTGACLVPRVYLVFSWLRLVSTELLRRCGHASISYLSAIYGSLAPPGPKLGRAGLCSTSPHSHHVCTSPILPAQALARATAAVASRCARPCGFSDQTKVCVCGGYRTACAVGALTAVGRQGPRVRLALSLDANAPTVSMHAYSSFLPLTLGPIVRHTSERPSALYPPPAQHVASGSDAEKGRICQCRQLWVLAVGGCTSEGRAQFSTA